jgi:hypothetical protein
MLYSKRRKNLGRNKRSNRKSFMSGGSAPQSKSKPDADVDVLCDLIYRNTPIFDTRYKQFFEYDVGSIYHHSVFTETDVLKKCIDSLSKHGYSPLYTACKYNSSLPLIQKLLSLTTEPFRQEGTDKNTAAHAVAHSYFINTQLLLPNLSNVQGLHDAAKNDVKCARSIEDKIEILGYFISRKFDVRTRNIPADGSTGKTVGKLTYEVEAMNCIKRVHQMLVDKKILLLE